MSEIQKIISSQTDAKQSAACLQDTIQGHFEKLHHNISDQQETQSKGQQWHEKTRQALTEHLDDISAKTLATQKTCDETNKNLARLATGHSVWQEGLQTHLGNEVAKQLQDRGSKIGGLEETLHQISQEWSKKLDLMKTSMHENDEQVKEYLQATICEIKTTLTKKLEEERVASEKDISKSETIHATVEAHLQQVKTQLEGLSSSGPESQLLRETLAEERKKTHDLQKQLATLEGDSGVNGELFQRQLRDLKAIDALKSQLEGMTEQVPRVESLNTTFNKMVDLNQVMQSTALYLSKERHWVNEQLGVTSQPAGTDTPRQNETGTQSAYFDEQRSEESIAWVQAKSTDTKGSASLSDLTTLDLHCQGERYRRKVVVASPALEASSPAPAPSVTQEQARRRGGSNPRSILRLSTASTHETETVRPPANHSQHNRPVMAKANSTTGCSNPEMVEQIRSGLIQPKPARPGWDFPTMEDFAKEILPSGKNDGSMGGKHSISLVDQEEDIASPIKRVKTEEAPVASQPESTDRPLLLRTRHVMRKMYSKQSN
jgi:acyl carrier protein phosphodiesterase